MKKYLRCLGLRHKIQAVALVVYWVAIIVAFRLRPLLPPSMSRIIIWSDVLLFLLASVYYISWFAVRQKESEGSLWKKFLSMYESPFYVEGQDSQNSKVFLHYEALTLAVSYFVVTALWWGIEMSLK